MAFDTTSTAEGLALAAFDTNPTAFQRRQLLETLGKLRTSSLATFNATTIFRQSWQRMYRFLTNPVPGGWDHHFHFWQQLQRKASRYPTGSDTKRCRHDYRYISTGTAAVGAERLNRLWRRQLPLPSHEMNASLGKGGSGSTRERTNFTHSHPQRYHNT